MGFASLIQIEASEFLLVILATFGAAFVSGIAGFGGSFVLAIALTPVLGPRAVIPAIAVYSLFANLGRLYIYRKSIHWRFSVQFVMASLPGLAFGSWLLKELPEAALLGIFGFVLLSAVPLRRILVRAAFKPDLATTVTIGVVFGAVSGAAVGSGMFVIAALNTFGLHGAVLLGTDAAIGIANAVSRVVAFWWLGLLDVRLTVIGVSLGAVSLPATWLASLVVRHIGQRLHSQIIEAIIVAAGASFLISAWLR
jgi:uncharacterized membrane protein YfcA